MKERVKLTLVYGSTIVSPKFTELMMLILYLSTEDHVIKANGICSPIIFIIIDL